MTWDFSGYEDNGAGLIDGEYTVTIEKAEVRNTKANDGEYINVQFKTDKGQMIFHMFNIKNKSEEATKIGIGQMRTLLRLGGKDPNKLHGVEELMGLRVNVTVKNKTDDYGTKPKITSFKPAPKAAESNPFA